MMESTITVDLTRIERGKLKGFANVTLSSELGEAGHYCCEENELAG